MRFQRRRRANTLSRTALRRSRTLAHRTGTLETLEKREMLAGDVASNWHNTVNPRDVNFDQRISTGDLLSVINELLRNGPHSLTADQATPLSSVSGASRPKYVDVNNDGRVSTADALMIVNALLVDKQMLVQTIVTDLADNEITQISVGSQFKLRTIVQDIRNPPQSETRFQGVFSAGADISYDSALTSINTGQTVEFGSFFSLIQDASLQQGRVVGYAATSSGTGPGNAPQFLFSVVLTATAAGIQSFTPALDTTDPNHEYGLYLGDLPFPSDAIEFVGDTLEILDLPGVSVGNVSQSEGDVDSSMAFTVALSQALAENATVQFATADDTATVANNDYVATSGTLTFAPGETVKLITVTIKGDDLLEPDETFNLVLSNPSSNITVGSGIAVGTIVNDDVQGLLSIVGSTVDNVPSGTTEGSFTVTLSQAIDSPVTVQYATMNGSAIAGVDYQAKNGTLTFNPGGSLTQVVPVTIIGDGNPDDVDTFFVNLSNPSSNAVLDVTQAEIIINPAVSAVSATITPGVAMPEGDAGLTPFLFTISLSAAAVDPVTVAYSTQDGSATVANNDYQATSGTLTFDPGVTSRVITVNVVGDSASESNENFFVNFEALTNAVGSGQAVGTIVDDDGPPVLTISNASVSAGSGLTQAVFTVTLSGKVTETVTVGFSTSDNSALAGVDYLTASGNLQFLPGGSSTQTISVTVLSSSMPQPDKTFFVNLSSPTGGATIEDDLGVGTIVTQGLSISDAVVTEGNTGTRNAVFTVTLSRQSGSPVTVLYTTMDDTATASSGDYAFASGTLTFAPDTTTQTITVQVNGDTVQEANETFKVVLSSAEGAPIFSSVGTGTILNDDGQKVAYLLSLTDTSGVPLPVATQFDVGDEFYLNVSVQDVQIDPQGVAQAFLDVFYNDAILDVMPNTLEFGDFYNDSFTVSDFQPGLLNDFGAFGQFTPPTNPGDALLLYRVRFVATDFGLATFTGSVSEDDLAEGNETLLYLTVPPTPVPSEQMSVVPLGGLPINVGSNVIAVANASAPENGQMVFTVTRFLPTAQTATVVFNTANGTAIAGQDYTATSGTLTFDAANPVRFVTVLLNDDNIDEPDETFSLVLSNPVNASISASAATGTILDNDNPPTVSVTGGSASEGSGVVFTVNLGTASGKTVTVAYATTGAGTATAGSDYTPVSGTLTFAPGTTVQSVTVPTLGDVLLEASETFQLALSNPTNATLGTAQATGTILDVPPAGISGYVYVDMNNNGLKDANETGLQGVLVTATNQTTGVSTSTTTAADGSYTFLGLIPGTYALSETQPGFFSDGRDTRFGVDSPINDVFAGIALAPSAAETGFNFGERGIRSEFITAFLDRRALFASSAVGGSFGANINMPGTALDLRSGAIWVSFDGGWSGLRQIDALFNSAAGSVTMKLYNNDLQEVALSTPTATGAMLLYNGQLGKTYFLKLTGTNPSVTVEISQAQAVSNLVTTPTTPSGTTNPPADTTTSGTSTSSTTTYVYDRFGNKIPVATPSADPLVDSGDDGIDDAFVEDEDWVLESLLA